MKGRRMPVDWMDHNRNHSISISMSTTSTLTSTWTTRQRTVLKSSLPKSSSTVRWHRHHQQQHQKRMMPMSMTNRRNCIARARLMLIFTLWATLSSSKTSSHTGTKTSFFLVDAAAILLPSNFPFKWRHDHNVTSNNDESNHILSLQQQQPQLQQQQQQNQDPQKSQQLVPSPMKQLQRTNEKYNERSRTRHHSFGAYMKQKSISFFRHQRQRRQEATVASTLTSPSSSSSAAAAAVNSLFSTRTTFQNYVPGFSNSYSISTMTLPNSRGSIIGSGSLLTAPTSSTVLSATLTSDNDVAQEEDESSSSSSSTSGSIHLTNGSDVMTPNQDSNSDDDITTTDTNSDNELSSSSQHAKHKPSRYILHTYRDPNNPIDIHYKGFNMCKRKFASWVHYTLGQKEDDDHNDKETSFSSSDTKYRNQNFDASYISSEEINIDDESIRNELRALWKQRRLLSERTEVLAKYQSDRYQVDESASADNNNKKNAKDELDTASKSKRGGFSDLLQLYAERLAAIIQDELEEEVIAATGKLISSDQDNSLSAQPQNKALPPKHMVKVLNNGGLLGWLEREYGQHGTQQLCSLSSATLPTTTTNTTTATTTTTTQDQRKEHFEILQNFMDWFRERFPYYYDRCGSCGASAKDDDHVSSSKDDDDSGGDNGQEEEEEKENIGKGSDIHNEKNQEEDIDVDDDNGTFLGYVYPDPYELLGKASRTEIYQCHKCNAFTRFPRYNAASVVIYNERGRCGEYSMLLYRLLRACGLQSRWVVDWADHVWAEILLDGKWIHLDPCEAAVDQPLLYESWGKQQTYIIAFHDGDYQQVYRTSSSIVEIPLIEDVTQRYTSESIENIDKRRSSDIRMEDTKVTVERVTQNLTLLLKQLKDK